MILVFRPFDEPDLDALLDILAGDFGRPMPEAKVAETAIDNEVRDALAGGLRYDDDLDTWRSPDDAPIGGTMGDAGDECTCGACTLQRRAAETPFQRVLRVADEPEKAFRYSAADLSAQGYTQSDTDPYRWEREFTTKERLFTEDAWSGARKLERKQAQAAQARDAFVAERAEREAKRRNGGILVLWTDTPGKPGAEPLYSLSHWGAH